jgi:putative acetyltransferase
LRISDEGADNAAAIELVIAAAFERHPHSNGREPLIVGALRAAGALSLSLVAEEEGAVVGHIAFSPVSIGDSANWFALGPVAVRPDRQREGIGAALLSAGLDRLRALGASGCTLVGEPAYYARFGFNRVDGLTCAGIPDRYVLAIGFGDDLPHGEVRYHAAFSALV